MAGALCLAEFEYSNCSKIVGESEMFWCFKVCRLRMIARVRNPARSMNRGRLAGSAGARVRAGRGAD